MRKLLLIVLVASGCASNPYSKFYHDNPHIENEPLEKGRSVEVSTGGDREADEVYLLERGYLFAGYSSFNSSGADRRGLVKHARKIGAERTVLYTQYTNTQSGAVPLLTPNNSYTTTNVSGNVGNTYYSGQGSSSTYGSNMTIVPVSVDRYDYLATYWKKRKKVGMGLYVVDLLSEEKATAGTNIGVKVRAVVINSPAYREDILNGDVILSVDGQDVFSVETFIEAIDRSSKESVDLSIRRGGEIFTKTIKVAK